MRIRKLTTSRLACVAACAGLALAFTVTPAWAGQVNLATKTTITTVITTDTGTIANTVVDTVTNTVLGTFAETTLDTVLLSTVDSIASTDTGTFAQTLIKTLDDGQFTIISTNLGSIANTLVSTSLATLTDTSANTIVATGVDTLLETLLTTEMGSIANTTITTLIETMIFSPQAADVSIEIAQDGLNFTSPFDNTLKALAIVNKVGVAGTRGISQVAAQSGVGNVSVASNSLIDGPMLVNFSHDVTSQVALKEIGVLALVPGLALQNSSAATTAHIAGLALTAAEATFETENKLDTTIDATQTVSDDSLEKASLVVAVDMVNNDINEYSPHGNSATVASLVENQVLVKATSGISQVTAQSGAANVAGAHNVLLIDGTFNANGSALNFNR